MIKKFIILVEETCPICEGKKEIRQEAWNKFFDAHPDLNRNKIPYPSNDAKQWFCDNDMADFIDDWNNLPSIMVECDTCNGSGISRHETSLISALQELNINIPLPGRLLEE